MALALNLHPDYSCDAVRGIDVVAMRLGRSRLALRYSLSGTIGAIQMPAVATSTRGHELWRHTCFEVFVRAAPSTAYYEFNFAPSTEWTAHRFEGRRTGVALADEIGAPDISVNAGVDNYEYGVTIDFAQSAILPAQAPWQLAITTVIEGADGKQSFWALAHAPGKPDFHNPDNFLLELPPVT